MNFRHSLPEIREVQCILSGHLARTTLKFAPIFGAGAAVYLKMETELPTGSFKPRGALAALALELTKRRVKEVTAASTGNHGAAVAWAAKKLGVRATIFLPAHPNPVKRAKIDSLGARVVEAGGGDLADALPLAREYSSREGVYLLDDSTDPVLPMGPATIGLEVLDQLPEVRCVYVPVGDTALIRGVSTAMKQAKPGIRIVGVQAERAPAYYLSWKKRAPVPTATCNTCADGLATRTPEPQNVEALRQLVDDLLLVSEEEILGAIGFLYRCEGVIAEPAGAAAAAAYRKRPDPGGPVALLVTGRNITDELRRRAGLPLATASEPHR